jgi:uncharacterized membrane protein
MADTDDANDHVEMTVQRMAELHAQQLEAQSALQRRVSRLIMALSRPRAVVIAAGLVLLWMLANLLAGRLGLAAFDPPPFAGLETVATVVALITTMMILATQAREDEAARRRSQLTLQLASLSDQKLAKVIQLLQEQRQDNPQLSDRDDKDADAMAAPADPGHVLERIKDTHEEA